MSVSNKNSVLMKGVGREDDVGGKRTYESSPPFTRDPLFKGFKVTKLGFRPYVPPYCKNTRKG